MRATYLLGTDRQQSTLNGSGFAARAYTPYGALAHSTGPALGYAGHPPDPFTGHYHLGNGHRSYNPQLQRFNSADRLSPFGKGGLNSYAYCLGNPVKYRDPNGQAVEDYLFPALSLLSNLLGVFITGMKMRSMLKLRKINSSSPGFTVAGVDAAIPPAATRKEWALSAVSGFSGVIGLGVGISRVAEPGKEWQSWVLAGLTGVSLVTSGMEAWKMFGAKPWKPLEVDTLQMSRFPYPGSQTSRSPSPSSIHSRRIRQGSPEVPPGTEVR